MATIKSYTDISQSRKLAEILPFESADMYYTKHDTIHANTLYGSCDRQDFYIREYIPCWSLSALLGVLPYIDFTMPQLIGTPKTLYRCMYNDNLKSHAYDNPVDACYEMILKLHELKML